MSAIEQVAGSENTLRVSIDRLDGGWSTRTAPHLLADNQLSVADNVVYFRDGIVSKRPGNELYGGGNGATGSGAAIAALARLYTGAPIFAQTVAHSGSNLWTYGNVPNGVYPSNIAPYNSIGTKYPATFTQMRDPDLSTGNAVALIICDGVRVPYAWDGRSNMGPGVKNPSVPFSTAAGFLPTGVVSGAPITPRFCKDWNQHLVLAGDPTDPGALYISDALRPERFSGYSFADSAGVTYIPYYPGGQDGTLGPITGLAVLGPLLVVFHQAGIVSAINTGTYGAFQFQFQRISSRVGAVSPGSIVSFDTFAAFFGGDCFYATDGQTVVPLVDEIPTVYSNTARSSTPPEIVNIATVVGVRRGSQYWAAYDSGSGTQDRIVVLDLAANGGYVFGAQTGGAWSRWLGMSLACAVECRGPGDAQQLLWGDSKQDRVLQHDTGTYDDVFSPITVEVRGKAYFFDKPVSPKTVQALYVLLVYAAGNLNFTDTILPYAAFDMAINFAPAITLNLAALPQYGSAPILLAAAAQPTIKSYPTSLAKGLSVTPGLTESSKYQFNMIGFVLEVTVDPPEFP